MIRQERSMQAMSFFVYLVLSGNTFLIPFLSKYGYVMYPYTSQWEMFYTLKQEPGTRSQTISYSHYNYFHCL